MDKNVMIVEDADFLRHMIKTILIGNGYNIVAEASNGLDALEAFKTHRPDITILDVVMTGMDGLTTLIELLKNEPSAKIVMCTALGHVDLVLSCILNGACGYILKPYSESKLIEVIEEVLCERPVFVKNTIEACLENYTVKKLVAERQSLDQDSIAKLLEVCKADEAGSLDFLKELLQS